jgi:DNA polymerase/3'-5' exonuclease PolX
MSTATRRSLAEATRIAEEFRDLFPPVYYEAWEIAGSIRRNKPEVGDAEHAVRPYVTKIEVSKGLFTEEQTVNMLWQQMDDLVFEGKLTKHIYGGTGPRYGSKYRGVEFKGMLHEIYLADELNWGCQLTIRTGPAEFSQRVVETFKLAGMYRQQNGYLRMPSEDGFGEIVPVPDEQTYLKLAGIPWVEPEDR